MQAAKTLFLLTATAATFVAAATAQACDALTENTLTNDNCPAACGDDPCVTYSPSKKACQSTTAAGTCFTEEAVSGESTCTLTYQCLDKLIVKPNKWFLALVPSKLQDSVTTAAVTEIKKMKYPPSGIDVVQVAGGLGISARGVIDNVKLDDSFFATPSSVQSFFLSEMNVQNALKTLDFSKRSWTAVAFNNVNLKEIPAGLAKLALQRAEFSKNFISNISDAAPFKNVSRLNLAFNDLTDLTIPLPAIVSLNLTGNPLTKIPDVLYSSRTLEMLSIRQCNLTNVALSEAQFAFLQTIKLEADLVVTSCPNGTIPQQIPAGGGSVCIPGTAETPAPEVVQESSGSSSTVLIVGIAAGVVVVALIAFFLCRRKPQSEPSTYKQLNDDTRTGGTWGSDDTGTGTTGIWGDPDLLAHRIEYRDIEPIKLLSRGGFGEVWLGLYMGENVAIKRLLGEKKTMDDALAFATEVKIMARLDHPKIVRFIGVAWTSALTIQSVAEFMDCGDLRSLLDSSRAPSLTWANLKCQIAIDIADALVYLHTLNPKLIHRDLKSRNVLIDANSGAKLTDFGISRNRSLEATMTAGVGTSRWIAPEVIMGGHYTEFADIYSFGVVLSELDTSKSPFHDAVNTNGAKMPDVTILQLVSAGKLQPSFESSCPESIVKLARACLSFDPAQRPSAIHISYELRKIFKDEL